MSYILGLDLGTSSIGWALASSNYETIIDSGVRIYQEAINIEECAKGESKNAVRRGFRQRRRQLLRKRYRKFQLLKYLIEINLIPENTLVRNAKGKIEINKDIFTPIMQINPYEFRHKAIHEKIDLIAIARILYHFAQHRGFLSSRKGEIKKPNNKKAEEDAKKDKQKVKSGIENTKNCISDTLGSYLYSIHPKDGEAFSPKERIRERYTSREMYWDEFERIWDFQKQFYPELLTDDRKFKIGDRKKGILFHVRPLKSQKHTLGLCRFESRTYPQKNLDVLKNGKTTYNSGKTRCPKSRIEFEEFRMLQFVNNIKFNGVELTPDQRNIVIKELSSSSKKLKIEKIIKLLKIQYVSSNYDDDGSGTELDVPACPTTTFINDFFPSQYWKDKNIEAIAKAKDRFWQILYFAKDDKWLIENTKKHFPEIIEKNFEYSDERIKKLCDFSFSDEYSDVSLKAINNINPFLRKGFQYHHAAMLGGIKNVFGEAWRHLKIEQIKQIEDIVEKLFAKKRPRFERINAVKDYLMNDFNFELRDFCKLYDHSDEIEEIAKINELPKPENLRNPRVEKALNELRKVVNKIIEIHGKPERIVLELATELKKNKKEIENIVKNNNINKKLNSDAEKFLNDMGLTNSRENRHKYILFKEMERKHGTVLCPYCLDKKSAIRLENLCIPDTPFEVDHIIPYSKSLNDSIENKVVCHAICNRNKAERTPFQFFGSDINSTEWKRRIEIADKLFFKSKKHRFLSERNPDLEDFLSSQLNDTRYISKKAMEYLRLITDSVQLVPGMITSKLRDAWGLNSILAASIEELEKSDVSLDEKNRADHRHHAIDAITLAFTKAGIAKDIATAHQYKNSSKYRLDLDAPFVCFRDKVKDSIEDILISFYQNNKIMNQSKKYVKIKGKDKKIIAKSIAIRGELHISTFYGKITDPNDNKECFHQRKKLEEFKSMDIVNKIVDSTTKLLLKDFIKKRELLDNSTNKINTNGFFNTDSSEKKIPLVFMKNKNGNDIPIYKIRVKGDKSNIVQYKQGSLDNNKTFVDTQNNHHVAIYKKEDGTYYEEMVTFWIAVERKKNKESIINKRINNKDIFITSLKINEMFILDNNLNADLSKISNKDLSPFLFRVQNLSSKDYVLRFHRAATTKFKSEKKRLSLKKLIESNPIKVKINILGKIELV